MSNPGIFTKKTSQLVKGYFELTNTFSECTFIIRLLWIILAAQCDEFRARA